MEIFIVLAITYIFSILLGKLLERIKIPWIFSALFLGLVFSFLNISWLNETLSSDSFTFLGNLGMYFMLFIIGLDLEKMSSLGRFILFSMLFIILFDVLLGTFIISSFGYPLIISLVAAFSFATVGEAVLVPILEEFKLLKKKLGTTILGIGIFDDMIEVFTIVLASFLIGIHSNTLNLELISISLAALFLLTYFLLKYGKIRKSKSRIPKIEDLFIFSVFLLFLFIAIGRYCDAEALGALLAGVSLKNFIPKKIFEDVEEDIKVLSYGFFGPIFFLWVGSSVNLKSIYLSPLLTISIFFVSIFAKLFASIISGYKYFGIRNSILLGTGLSVRFSTGLVISQLLFTKQIIDQFLFSALVSASALSTVLVPIVFSLLLHKWKKYIQ